MIDTNHLFIYCFEKKKRKQKFIPSKYFDSIGFDIFNKSVVDVVILLYKCLKAHESKTTRNFNSFKYYYEIWAKKQWFNSRSRLASSFSIESLPQLILTNDILYGNLFQSCFVASIRFAATRYYYYLIGFLYQINSYRVLFTDFNKATIVQVNQFQHSCLQCT